MKKFKMVGLVLALTLALASVMTACSDKPKEPDGEPSKATISVLVDGAAQTNGGTFAATVGNAYTVAATSSNAAAVSVKYVFQSTTTELNGTTFTPAAEGSYAFTFTANGADGFTLTVTATQPQQNPPQVQQCNVEFALGEHAASDANPVVMRVVAEGAQITLPSAPKAASGYKFAGWSDGTNTYKAGATYTVTQAVTFTATWDVLEENAQVTVDFALGDHHAQNATVPQSQTVDAGGTVTLPAAIEAEEGYLFDGWSDGTNTYAAKAAYTADTDCTITALWKIKPAVTNGDFETGDLTGWTVVVGAADMVTVDNYARYWEDNELYHDANGNTVLSVLQEGEYYLTTLPAGEANKVSVKSENFTLKGEGIISFKFGAAGNADCYVALCDANGNELIKTTNQGFKDPGPAQAMYRHFIYANDYIGQQVYIKLVDNAASGFGFIEFDDLKVNLTVTQAREILTADKQWANNYYPDITSSSAGLGANTYTAVEYIRNYYRTLEAIDVNNVYFTQKVANQSVAAGAVNLNTYLTEIKGSMLGVQADSLTPSIVKVNDGNTDYNTGFDSFDLAGDKTYTVTYRLTDSASGKYAEATFTIVTFSAESHQIVNGDFEEGDLSGWSIVEGAIDLTGGVSDLVHNDWAEKLPYNKSGNYFCFNAGLGEHAKWELKSSVFTLDGNGYISFKMASNNTFLKVYKEDGTQVFYYTCKTYADVDFPHVEKGTGNWCTLRTHYADLSQYIGQKLYITIGNLGLGGAWEFGYFDDIITYYEEGTVMTAKKENVTLTCTNSELSHAEGATWEVAWIKAENEL